VLRQMLVCYESILTGESRAFCSETIYANDVMKRVRGQIAEVGTLAASPSRKARDVGHPAHPPKGKPLLERPHSSQNRA
jgi:hypothetical protein